MKARHTRSRGFTLMEVLVALAVLGIAMGAIIKVGSSNAGNAVHLRDKTFAHWVAVNQVSEWRLLGEWPAVGDQRGVALLAGREWAWRINTSQTPDPDLRRLDVEVRASGAGGAPLATLVGFIGRPAEAGDS